MFLKYFFSLGDAAKLQWGGGRSAPFGALMGLKIRVRTRAAKTHRYFNNCSSTMQFQPQTKEHIDWRWPLSCVQLVLMVISSQIGEGGSSRPPPFALPPRLELRPPPPLHPLPAKLARECCLYSPMLSLSLSLWFQPYSPLILSLSFSVQNC